jgi:hypothetical protein
MQDQLTQLVPVEVFLLKIKSDLGRLDILFFNVPHLCKQWML